MPPKKTTALVKQSGMTAVDVALLQAMMRQTSNTYLDKNPRHIKNDMKAYRDDFNNFYGATENIMNQSGTGNLYGSSNLMEMEFLSNKRLGVGNNITDGFAEDALFNWFNLGKVDNTKSYVTLPGFNKWIVDTDFKNQAIIWDAHKRKFGIGLMVKFWTSHDDLSLPAPHTPPRKFQVISPLFLAPTNTYETRYLDYDEDLWEFMGGNVKISHIHRSRIEVVRGPPQQGDYRGLSVIEINYLSLICYYNALIYITKGLSKWGSMVPVIKSGSPTPTVQEYNEFLKLMDAYVMNGYFFLGKEDSLEYPQTNIATGLYQLIELLKEDIASGTRIPLNKLFGRAESGGIGGEGALTAERTYLNLLANEQTRVSDDMLRIFRMANFDVDGLELKWNLALQKTSEQQLIEEQMRLNNQMLEQQLKMMKQENIMMKTQQELFDQHKDQFTPEQQLVSAEQIKEDFRYSQKRFDDFKRLQNMISLRSKPDRMMIAKGE